MSSRPVERAGSSFSLRLNLWYAAFFIFGCFALFLRHEARAEHPMLDLRLFRIRNFWVANLTTFTAYAGLIGGLFFLPLYLQQIAGYSALDSGLATTPISIVLFILSPRFGRIASDTGPRLPMSAGPIVAGLGMLLMLRTGPDGDYLADILPAILVFALGLAATVAPLTAAHHIITDSSLPAAQQKQIKKLGIRLTVV